MTKIPYIDEVWATRALMPYFGMHDLAFAWSDSKAKYPDLWCQNGAVPVITVTREWARQPFWERRKRLVHEALHLARGLKDNVVIDGLLYSTYPDKDEYSRKVYYDVIKLIPWKHQNPRKRLYDVFLEEIKKQWDWPGIVRLLKLREAARPVWDESDVSFYLGNYMKIGPVSHYYDKIYSGIYSLTMMQPGYRLGQWFEAMHKIATEHGLHLLLSDEDPADLYAVLGVLKVKEKDRAMFDQAVDQIEGFHGITSYTRAIYADEMRKSCPGCGGKINRDDLIHTERITAGEEDKYLLQLTPEGTRKKAAIGKTNKIKKINIWHKDCWLAAHGQQPWYRPGILAEDVDKEEELAEAVALAHPKPADFKFKPVVELPPEPKPWWKRITRRNVMKRRYYNPSINAPTHAAGAPSYRYPDEDYRRLPSTTAAPVRYETERLPAPYRGKSNMLSWLIVALILGGGAFGLYWYFYKHKYSVGNVLQHTTEPASSFQISGLKYVGMIHTYVMIKDMTTAEEHPVKEIDNDPAWVQLS